MKILFYDTQNYDRESFDRTKEQFPEIEVEYLKTGLAARTASLAKGYDAVCAFVNSDVGTKTVEALHEAGVKLILMRCAGFNNVDLKTAAKYGIDVRRVPGYSPEAVAEHAMTLAMTVNRHMHKAYTKVRENDFSLGGLMGFNFYQKTAGIVGTGKIGAAMARICRGFGMKVIAYDVYQNESLKDFVTYVTLDELLAQSDLISLHFSTPQDIFLSMTHPFHVWLDFFVSLYRYTLKVLISLYVFIAIFQSPLRMGRILHQPAKHFMLEHLSLSCIQGCRFLSGLE